MQHLYKYELGCSEIHVLYNNNNKKEQIEFHPAKLHFQKDCGLSPLLAQKKGICWRALDASLCVHWPALGHEHPSGCTDVCCFISLRWRGAAGEGVQTVHPPRDRIPLLAGNVWPNSLSIVLTSPQRSSPQLHYNAASLWKGAGKLLESSPKFMCYKSLRAL